MKKIVKMILLIGLFVLFGLAGITKSKAENCPKPLEETRKVECPAEPNATATGYATQIRYKEMLNSCKWGEWKSLSMNCSYNCAAPMEETRKVECPAEPNATATGYATQIRYKEMLNSCKWGEWKGLSTNCSYNCAAPLEETQTLSCPDGREGTITKTRTKDMLKNCAWGEWRTLNSTCLDTCPNPLIESKSALCSDGKTNAVKQTRKKELWNNCNWSKWTEDTSACPIVGSLKTKQPFFTQPFVVPSAIALLIALIALFIIKKRIK